MEQIKAPVFPYAKIDFGEMLFDGNDDLHFEVRFPIPLNEHAYRLIIDIHDAFEGGHATGHAAWWSHSLDGEQSVTFSLSPASGALDARFNGAEAENKWLQDGFAFQGRVLDMQIVLRETRSNALVFHDAVRLYPSLQVKAAVEAHLPKTGEVQSSIWYVWPSARRVHAVFGSLRSEEMRDFCLQLKCLFEKNGIPFTLYGSAAVPWMRSFLSPSEYLQHAVEPQDIIFYAHADASPVIGMVAPMQCTKILYYLHQPDLLRFQVFDAGFARRMEQEPDHISHLGMFEALCYESEPLCAAVTKKLRAHHFNEQDRELRRFLETCCHAATAQDDMDGAKKADTEGESLHVDIERDLLLSQMYMPSKKFHAPIRLRCSVDQARQPETLGIFRPLLWQTWKDNEEGEALDVKGPFLLCVAPLTPDSGIEATLDIFSHVAAMSPVLSLVIAGPIHALSYVDYLRATLEQTYNDAADRVILLPNPGGPLPFLYRHAGAFICSYEYEGFSKYLFRALASRLLVIARKSTFSTRLLGFSGLQFSRSTPPRDVAQSLVAVMNDPELKNRIIAGQLASARMHDEPEAAKALLNAFERIL